MFGLVRLRFRSLIVALAFAIALVARPARAVNEPTLEWKTLHTPHFKVTYYSGSEEVAQHVADTGEAFYASMSEELGWVPTEIPEIVLTDQVESANGSATSLPYNTVRIFMTAPEDMSPLGDVDDWYLELLTHEYTHVLHTDHVRGIPALVNAVLGKSLAPNQAQPRWIIEGLAVMFESNRTSGGRLRSGLWDMWMRTDVLEDNIARLDQMNGSVRRWPQGNIAYLYGSFFIDWITKTYGYSALRAMLRDYGSQLIPWGINRSARRATGRTFEELYPAWTSWMKKHYAEQAARVRQRGLRPGRRITFHGQYAAHPRFVPEKAWSGHAGEVAYYADDLDHRVGVWTLPVTRDAAGHVVGSKPGERTHMIRTSDRTTSAFHPDGHVVFSNGDVSNFVFSFNDLFAVKAGERSENGREPRQRMTTGFRAAEPDVSPDGRHVVFVTNHRGTRYLQIGDLSGAWPLGVTNVRALVQSEPFEQAYGPRFSPDGRHVAYSVWTRGGYRDIRVVDVATGTWELVAHDRAQDGGPSFTPDGRYVLFHSDRFEGIYNVYAWERSTRRLFQVTNTLAGAFQPQASPDGKSVVFVGYTKIGYDLFAIDFDPAALQPAAPYVDTRPQTPPLPPRGQYVQKPYEPWRTLVPRRYSVQITPGNYGQAVVLTTQSIDISGLHSLTASATVELEKPEPQVSASYVYAKLPFDVGLSAYRSIAPRGIAIGTSRPDAIQETTGLSTSVSVPLPRAFESHVVAASYSFARVAGEQKTPIEAIDPYSTPTFPFRGFLGSTRIGYAYSNAESFFNSVGAERGFSLGVGVDLTDKMLASDFSGYAANGDLSVYLPMPWREHHSLALHLGTGMSGGNFPGRAFYTGGFVDLPLLDVLRNQLIQGGVVLRGYPPAAIAGRYLTLGNAEYRFPIVVFDRGLSTLPVQVNRLTGAIFTDYGSAFDDPKNARFKMGSGAEATIETTLGYYVSFQFRLGYARGWHSGGTDKVYFIAAVPY